MSPVRAWCVKGPDGEMDINSILDTQDRGSLPTGYSLVPVLIYEAGEARVVAWKLGNHIYADVPNFQRDYPSSTPLFDRPDGAEEIMDEAATILRSVLWNGGKGNPTLERIYQFLKDRKHG